MALGPWALLLAGATGEGCVRLYVLWIFFGVDLGFRLVRRADERQIELGRELNKGHHQGTTVRGVEMQMVDKWKARPVMLNCSVQVSFFAASIFFALGAEFGPENAVTKSAHPALAFCIHHPASSLTGCFHLPRQFPTARSSRLEAPRNRTAEHWQTVFIVPIHLLRG